MHALHAADPDNTQPVPVDLVTASGSGLDPHISLAAAAATRLPGSPALRGSRLEQVQALIDQHTAGPQLGFLGEPRVNVLELNLALDALKIETMTMMRYTQRPDPDELLAQIKRTSSNARRAAS